MTKTKPVVSKKTTHIVSLYFTPLSILLVVTGLVVAPPEGLSFIIAVALLGFSLVFNLASISWIELAPVPAFWKIQLRVWLNIAVNVVFVYILGAEWEPIWLLLMLSPVASALYGSRRQTELTAFFAAAVLLVIQYLRYEDFSAVVWAQQGIRGAFIILLSAALFKFTQAAKDHSV